jgi:hypothetical protein
MHQNRPSHKLGSSILHAAWSYESREVVIGVAGEMFVLFSVPAKCQNVLGECNKPLSENKTRCRCTAALASNLPCEQPGRRGRWCLERSVPE